MNQPRKQVIIVYRDLWNDSHVVEAIVYTPEQALSYMTQLKQNIDPMFGISSQEWEMDADEPINANE